MLPVLQPDALMVQTLEEMHEVQTTSPRVTTLIGQSATRRHLPSCWSACRVMVCSFVEYLNPESHSTLLSSFTSVFGTMWAMADTNGWDLAGNIHNSVFPEQRQGGQYY